MMKEAVSEEAIGCRPEKNIVVAPFWLTADSFPAGRYASHSFTQTFFSSV
jgi:hypothetical protein